MAEVSKRCCSAKKSHVISEDSTISQHMHLYVSVLIKVTKRKRSVKLSLSVNSLCSKHPLFHRVQHHGDGRGPFVLQYDISEPETFFLGFLSLYVDKTSMTLNGNSLIAYSVQQVNYISLLVGFGG